MNELSLMARRRAAQLLLSPLAALCALAPASTLGDSDAQEKLTAERVARKLEKAGKTEARMKKAERKALRDFGKELSSYAQLHSRAAARVGSLASTVAQKALAAAIIARRTKARQGDLFLAEIQPLFKQRIGEQLKGPDARAAQKAVVEGNPGHDEDSPQVPVRVNAPYPPGAARSTVPPSVLLSLPPLPDCLNYLFVGRSLVLVDAEAQIIVDFLPLAAPELIK